MSEAISSRRPRADFSVAGAAVTGAIWCSGAAVLASLAVVVTVVLTSSWTAIADAGLGAFLFQASWHPTQGQFGLLPMMATTLVISAGGLLLAVPLGIICAVYIVFYSTGSLRFFLQVCLKLLTGVPSVVFGLVCLHSIVPAIGYFRAPGVSLLAGILVLAVMITPTIALILEAVLQKGATQLYRGGLSLGMRRDRAIRKVVLPSIGDAVIAAAAVGFSRAAGETMAVMMVMGNVVRWPNDLFGPARAMTTNIALEMAYAVGTHRAGLFLTGLFILSLVLVVSVIGFYFMKRVGRDASA